MKEIYSVYLTYCDNRCDFYIFLNSKIACTNICLGIILDSANGHIIEKEYKDAEPDFRNLTNEYFCGWIYASMLKTIFDFEDIAECFVEEEVLNKIGIDDIDGDIMINANKINKDVEDYREMCSYDNITIEEVERNVNRNDVEIKYKIIFS